MDDNQLIDAYLSNELDGAELASFEARLATDQKLATAVEQSRLIIQGIEQTTAEADLIHKMEQWDGEESKSKVRKMLPYAPWKAAAVFIPLLIGVGLMYYFMSTSTDQHPDLFAEYFTPYEDVVTTRSGTDSHFERGMSAYNAQNYAQAIQLFELALNDDSQKLLPTRLYLGVAHLSLDELEEAQMLLQQVARAENPLYSEVANWYLLLALVKTNQTKDVDEQLDLILSDEDHLYYSEAVRFQEEWEGL